jgi:hypothetical protein
MMSMIEEFRGRPDEEAEAAINAILKRAERTYETAARQEADSKFAEDNKSIAARNAARQVPNYHHPPLLPRWPGRTTPA